MSAGMRGLDESVGELVDRFEGMVDELVDEIMQSVYEHLPTLDERARLQLEPSMRFSAYSNVRASLQAVKHRRHEPAETPTEALEEARAAARTGLRLSDLLAMYRIGQRVCLDRCLLMAPEVCPDPATRTEVLRIVSRFMFAYVDCVMTDVSQVFEREREEFLRSRTQRRVQMIRDILEGSSFGPEEIGYDLLRTHVGLVASGTAAAAVTQRMVRELGARSLSVAASGDTVWTWLATDRAPDLLSAGGDVRIGVGDARAGVEGFRSTHRQALAAAGVATRLAMPVCRYDDVGIEAVALGDEPGARRFVERELGPLGGRSARDRTLRSTMYAYLRSAHNASLAAARLGISDRTVAYRLRTCEERLGRSVSARPTELETALRWGRLFGMFDW